MAQLSTLSCGFLRDPCTIRCTPGGRHSADSHPGQTVSISALVRKPGSVVNKSFDDIGSSPLKHGISLHLFPVQHNSKEQRYWKPPAL